MGIFDTMVEALVIFKILFDLMLEIGMAIYRAAAALIRLIVAAIKSLADSSDRSAVPVEEPVSVEITADE